MKKYTLHLSHLLFVICYLLFTAPAVHAACNFHASMTNTTKDLSSWTSTCTVATSTVEGIDKTTLETGTTNTAALTLSSGGSITINAGGELIVGSLDLSGGSIAIQDSGESSGTIQIGAPLYIADADADGWPTDFTLYNATSSGRRRLALMRDFGTIDCGDSIFSLLNVCTGGTGNDGAVTFSAHTNINTTNRITGRTCTQGGDAVNYSVSSLTSTTATLTSSPAATCLVAGDEVLLINLQGTYTSYDNVGNYEFLTISSISTSTITFTSSKVNLYGNNGGDTNIGTATSNQRVMLQRVPNYTDVTVNSGINVYPSAWDGVKGGVIALRASGTLTITGTIHANGYGYAGGPTSIPGCYFDCTDYKGGNGGESFCGAGGTGTYSNGNAGAGGGGGGGTSGGIGAIGYCGAGSGGTGSTTKLGSNTGGSGGAGGGRAAGGGAGYGSAGTRGNGIGGTDGGTNVSGSGYRAAGGGGTYGASNLSDIYFGSGGGGGGGGTVAGPDAGNGGGIIIIESETLSVSSTGRIQSTGTNAGGGTGCSGVRRYGGAGGASGGSIKITATTATLGTNYISAAGGAGAWSCLTGASLNMGGAGGSGRIAIDADSVSGTTNPTYTAF